MSTEIPLARRDVILRRLGSGESVVASALAIEFAVSEDAIRRDLRALAAEGRCRRVYGGALPVGVHGKPMAARMGEDSERKVSLARAAASTIQRDEFLFLDTSSTNLALVNCLPEDFGLTVATNSVDIAAAVLRRGDIPLMVVGGSVEATVGGCVDADAVQAVAALGIDRCFVGACAVSAVAGLSAAHHGDAQFKRALVAASQVVVALITNEKLGSKAAHRVMNLASIDFLIVEADAPEGVLTTLRETGAIVQVAAASA